MEKIKNTELKIQKLREKRDELAEQHMEPYGVLKTQLSFKSGFDAAIAEVIPMMREMAETIRYVMNENDKVKGWDKLHDTWYAYQKLVEND